MEELPKYRAYSVPCSEIYYDDSFNCRGAFTLESVKALADNIGSRDLDIPVTVQPAEDVEGGLPDGFGYRLLAGHRRYRAVTRFLKWTHVPAYVRHDLSEHDARILNFTENLERKDLNPLEEAMAIRRLYPKLGEPGGTSLRTAGRELSKDWSWVHKRLKILRLPEPVQQMIAARRLFLYDIEIVLSKSTIDAQIQAAEALVASKRGRGRKAVFEDEPLLRSFRRRRTKAEISTLIAEILRAGVSGLAPRVAAWCAGYVSDDDIAEEILKERKSKTASPA